jgi:periplasmic glucans biosynthesis protein
MTSTKNLKKYHVQLCKLALYAVYSLESSFRMIANYMINRRAFVSLLSSVALVSYAANANAQSRLQGVLQGVMASGKPFSRDMVVSAARELAKQPYLAPSTQLPDPFAGLSLEQYNQIQAKAETSIWADQQNGFMVEPLHRGYVYDVPVLVYTVSNDVVFGIAYDQNRFNFGKLTPPTLLPDLAYSGLKIHTVQDGVKRELVTFQGATFYRSLAKGQVAGSMARAVSIRTGDPRGEEISQFRAFWLEQPKIGSPLVVHALADSESLVVAFRFTIHANDATIMDTEATFFPRVAIDNIGFGGMQAMHFFSPASPRRMDGDYRASSHEASGLQVQRGNNEWLWRPLNNPAQLQVSSFLDENVKGFGLVQRNRDFGAYQDDNQHYELKPTLWIEPLNDWGQGAVQLVEIPTEADVNQNILAFWRPKNTLNAGQELNVAYRQFWSWKVHERPDLGSVTTTRVGRLGAKRRRFLIEFSGNQFNLDRKAEDFKLILTNNLGAITAQKLIYDPDHKIVRVIFDLDPANETLIELRALIELGGIAQTETWLYRWTP